MYKTVYMVNSFDVKFKGMIGTKSNVCVCMGGSEFI